MICVFCPGIGRYVIECAEAGRLREGKRNGAAMETVGLGVVVALVVAACGSEGGKGVPRTAESVGIVDMLQLVPDIAPVRSNQLMVNLYWRAAAAGGVEVPAAGADVKQTARYMFTLTSDPQAGIGARGSTLAQQAVYPEVPAATGFGIADVAADISAAVPPGNMLAARGRFDTGHIDEVLRADSTWADALTTPTQDGTTIYRWLDDHAMDLTRRRTGLFTDIGGSRRFAFPEASTFVYTRDDATMRAALNARAGGTSLAADPEYAALAAALDGQQVYSAVVLQPSSTADLLSGPVDATTDAAELARRKSELDAYGLGPYRLAGIGQSRVDGTPRTVIALVNADEAAAATNVDRLRTALQSGSDTVTDKPWSTMFAVESVTAKGELTVAVLTSTGSPPKVTQWFRLAMPGSNLLTIAG